jgi:hypothetical protein
MALESQKHLIWLSDDRTLAIKSGSENNWVRIYG